MTVNSTMTGIVESKNEAAVAAGPKVASVEALRVAGAIEAKRAGYTFGCDLGDKHSDVCVLDAQGDVVARQQIRSTKKGFEGYFGNQEPSRVAIEVGGHSRWVSALVKDLGYDVVIANPRQVKLISQNHRKRDGVDGRGVSTDRAGDVRAARLWLGSMGWTATVGRRTGSLVQLGWHANQYRCAT